MEEMRLRREETILWFIDYPSRPQLHKYILIIIGAAIVAFNFYIQLPANPAHFKDTDIHINTLFSFPFLMLAILIEEKTMLRTACDNFRSMAKTDNINLTYFQLEQMAIEVMVKLWRFRLFNMLLVTLTWFLILHVMLRMILYFYVAQ